LASSRKGHDLQKRIDELQRSEALFREIVENQAEPVCRFLSDGAIVYANPAFCRLACMDLIDLIGRNILNPSPGVEILKSLPLVNFETPSIGAEVRITFPARPAGGCNGNALPYRPRQFDHRNPDRRQRFGKIRGRLKTPCGAAKRVTEDLLIIYPN